MNSLTGVACSASAMRRNDASEMGLPASAALTVAGLEMRLLRQVNRCEAAYCELVAQALGIDGGAQLRSPEEMPKRP